MKSEGIKIRGVYKYYYSIGRGKIVALKDINIEIQKGEFFVILGPSGCGKSTLLNIIAGLEKPSQGEIWFGNSLICSTQKKIYLNPKERNVAMVFQSYALYPHMTVFDNIAFPLNISRTPKEQIKKRVIEVATMLGIKQLLRVKPKELSGGQRQRVAMARAIIRHPYLFLLDEPLSNLDAKLRVRMRSELTTLQRKLGVTTIYVTHDQVEAMTLGQRIAVLKDGEMQQIGSPLDVYNRPRNKFVAGFLGTPPMNILDTKVLEKEQKICIIVDDVEIDPGEDKLKFLSNYKGKNLMLGVRPEDIEVLPYQEQLGFAREIKLIEHLGNEIIMHFQLGDQEILTKIRQDQTFKHGDMVKILIDKDRLHFFDKDGNNIEEMP